jgi:hypothetical protein
LQVGTPSEARIQAVVESTVNASFRAKEGDGAVTISGIPIRSGSSSQIVGVKVTLSQRKKAVMSGIVTPTLTDISVTAVARSSGATRVCVVGLDPSAADAIHLDNSAQILAGNCSVYANSTSPSAIRADGGSKITSLLTCTAGGYRGYGSNYAPSAPLTDCPRVPDPLADRPPPVVESCPKKPLKIKKQTTTLNPGTYCGGLYIENGANVTLNPGIYVMKDGPLVIGPAKPGAKGTDKLQDKDDDGTPASRGSVKGSGVGFYFTGQLEPNDEGQLIAMRFEQNSVVELTAPTNGSMSGLLLQEDRTVNSDRRYEVLSDGARRLVGTIYLPRGTFEVSANQSVADQSEYTAVVTKRLELFQAPNLVLNTRYGDTNVPVPDGLGPNSNKFRIVQ